jgi:hypothetical protein
LTSETNQRQTVQPKIRFDGFFLLCAFLNLVFCGIDAGHGDLPWTMFNGFAALLCGSWARYYDNE